MTGLGLSKVTLRFIKALKAEEHIHFAHYTHILMNSMMGRIKSRSALIMQFFLLEISLFKLWRCI